MFLCYFQGLSLDNNRSHSGSPAHQQLSICGFTCLNWDFRGMSPQRERIPKYLSYELKHWTLNRALTLKNKKNSCLFLMCPYIKADTVSSLWVLPLISAAVIETFHQLSHMLTCCASIQDRGMIHYQLVLLQLAPPLDNSCLVPQLEPITGAGLTASLPDVRPSPRCL